MRNIEHLAIIMDGNGRWAEKKGLIRTQGHQEGLVAAKRIVKHAATLHIPYVTLYTFSTENWKRAKSEVGFLMKLIKKHLKAELQFYAQNNIRVQHIGDRKNLPKDIQTEIQTVSDETAHFSGTTLVLAINYGGRDELLRAIHKIPNPGEKKLSEQEFTAYLDTKNIPPVDLLIRTGGEKRISNFLLWQTAYAELHFTDVLWPDYSEQDLDTALSEYTTRQRRFGGV